MALTDQKPEHFEYRNKVKDFNDKLKKHIVDKEERVDERIKCIQQRIPELINNTLLDRYLITNSRGQHKDERERMREEIHEAEFEDSLPGICSRFPFTTMMITNSTKLICSFQDN